MNESLCNNINIFNKDGKYFIGIEFNIWNNLKVPKEPFHKTDSNSLEVLQEITRNRINLHNEFKDEPFYVHRKPIDIFNKECNMSFKTLKHLKEILIDKMEKEKNRINQKELNTNDIDNIE